MQLPELAKFEAQRSAKEVHLACNLNESPKRDPLQGNRMSAAESIQVKPVSMVRADHC